MNDHPFNVPPAVPLQGIVAPRPVTTELRHVATDRLSLDATADYWLAREREQAALDEKAKNDFSDRLLFGANRAALDGFTGFAAALVSIYRQQ